MKLDRNDVREEQGRARRTESIDMRGGEQRRLWQFKIFASQDRGGYVQGLGDFRPSFGVSTHVLSVFD